MNFVRVHIIAMLSVVLLLLSCTAEIDHRGRTPLVGVGNDFLYKEDVVALNVTALPSVDSAEFVHNYIRGWLEDALFYRMAARNVASAGEVDRMVENYRRALLLNIYQERLVEQQLKQTLADEDVEAFYKSNADLFKLEEAHLQGLFLKLPLTAPKLQSVRKWLTKMAPEDIENLEKYNITNAVTYDYFVDSWRSLPSVAAKMPLTAEALLKSLEKSAFVEAADTAYIYMLTSVAKLDKGEQAPLELASDEIKSLLINSMKANFVKGVKRDLYNKALEQGEIIFYDTESSATIAAADYNINRQ